MKTCIFHSDKEVYAKERCVKCYTYFRKYGEDRPSTLDLPTLERPCKKGHINWYVTPQGDKKCRTCQTEDKKARRHNDPESHNKRIRTRERYLRMEVILAYGGRCVCCGESQYEFLALDHVNNDGASHRASSSCIRRRIYHWAKMNDYPDTLQVLCHNCNCAKGYYGYCPHHTDMPNISNN